MKKTIIESMTDGDNEEAIKLSVYRGLVADFEQEYNDIYIWYKKESNGENIVQRQAEQVISAYREAIAYEYQIRNAIHELNFAVQYAQDQLPIVQDEVKHIEEQMKIENQHKKDIEGERDRELAKLREAIGRQKYLIDQIREKRKRYVEMDIETMLRLHHSEPQIRNEREKQQGILNALTKQYADIEDKYNNLIEQLNISLERFKNNQETQLNKLREEVRNQREQDIAENKRQLEEAEKRCDEDCQQIEQKIDALQGDLRKAELKMQELRNWQPYAEEKAALQKDLNQLDTDEKEAKAIIEAKGNAIKLLRSEANVEVEKANSDYEREDKQLRTNLQKLQEELDNIHSLLARYKGSLYEWLANTDLPWEETIGKVIDEERVLYAQGLSPVLSGKDNDSFYGVQLDLSQVEPTHRSPDDYRKRGKELEEQIEGIKKQLDDLLLAKDQKIAKINARLSEKIRPLQQEVTNYGVRLDSIPQQRRDKQTAIDSLVRKEQEERNNKVAEQQDVINGIILNISNTKTERKNRRSAFEKEKKQINAILESKGKELEKKVREFKAALAEEKEKELVKYNQQKHQYETEREKELKGKGADTEIIQKQKDIISGLDQQLQTIESQKQVVYDYIRDKADLFDKEDSIKQEKKLLEEKVSSVQSHYEEKARRIIARLTEWSINKDEKNAKIKEWTEGIDQYKLMIDKEHLLSDAYLQDAKVKETTKSCKTIIAELHGAINDKKRKQEELKRNVNNFNNHFKPNNIFKFNTTPVYDEDYIAIALSLQEFMDNNKIEEYRKRTSELYQNILQGVSREVGNLMTHQSEIETIIRDINRDFEKKAFAGVIKSIELRSEPSDDSLMRLLQRIQEFAYKNAQNMGSANLFSDNNKEDVNRKAVEYLIQFMKQLLKEPNRQQLTLSDTFNLQFRVRENDHSTGWVERINNVGSDGTDILVKAMINIMLINVFKNKAARNKNQEFIIHCMMDEIGKLHPSNVKGILDFANTRNIYLINSSPMSYNPYDYRYTYMLSKDSKSMTQVTRLLKNRKN
ncbi:MAG: ATP-binding protein [Bacteroidales bacterium]|nr:ATP-binding protein [Bacteroidales bacterium]